MAAGVATGDHIVQILLEHKADHSVRDEIFYSSPLSVTERMGVWSAVNVLLHYHADKDDHVLTKNNFHYDEYVQVLLKEAISGGLLEILKFVFEECGILQTECGRQLWTQNNMDTSNAGRWPL
jgi:hypothetical protein